MPRAPPGRWQHLPSWEGGRGRWDGAFSYADPLPTMLLPPVETPFGVSYRRPSGKPWTIHASSRVAFLFGEGEGRCGTWLHARIIAPTRAFRHDSACSQGPVQGWAEEAPAEPNR